MILTNAGHISLPFRLCLLLAPSSLPLLVIMVQHTQTKPLRKDTEESALGAENTWIQQGWKCYIDPSDNNIWHTAERQ